MESKKNYLAKDHPGIKRAVEKAVQYQSDAQNFESNHKRSAANYALIKERWEEAGEAWENAQRLDKAQAAYLHALRYAPVGGGTSIQERYNKIKNQRLKLHSGFKKAGLNLERKLAEEADKNEGRKRIGFAILSIASLVIALLSVSFNVTGNAIGNITSDNFKWVGVCFFICGLVFALIFLKQRK